MKTSIGNYINRDSQEIHEVFEVVNEVIHPSNTQVHVLPSSKTYITGSEITAQKLNDDLSSFELIEIDGIIHKVTT